MFYIYVLESIRTENLYIGITNNLKRRIEEHNQGENTSTKPYKPWQCIYYEACLDEKDARRREKYLKTSQGRRLLKRRLREYFYKRRRRGSRNFTIRVCEVAETIVEHRLLKFAKLQR